ncbi:MAG TPA: CoA transferase [Dehalococcoidia bacterium]|nr:CoA transferase [Dehalococcoidia bacterium]
MHEDVKRDTVLGPYRVLDLADEKGLLCGKILGDLGADVIKIEKPGGDEARRLGPFYHDDPDPEKSLFWFALNTSKKGITLDIEQPEGREIFKQLVKTADFVIETFPPGYLDDLGLGYTDLETINPGVILVSITPFGQTGPYKNWKTADIVAWAMGGDMAPWGDVDRPPLHFSHHSQAYLHAGADGAQGALTALYYRWLTSEGQQIDVSIQESVVQCLEHITGMWDIRQVVQKRGGGGGMMLSNHRTTQIWPCKDGWVSWSHGGNSVLSPSFPLIKWMEEEGVTSEFLKNFDWERPDFPQISQEEMDQIEEPTARFFMERTKAELLEGAVKNRIMLYPVSTTPDLLESVQLKSRDFWQEIDHPELGITLTYPGAFAATSEAKPNLSRRAPHIGEHNREIYGELGLTEEKIEELKQSGVI